ncbi:hypothetical protein KR067_008161, partial [Drosophila pandora]
VMAPCVLCRSYDKDELIFGPVHQHGKMWMHTNCLYLSSNLKQRGNDDNGILCFLPEDIEEEARRCRALTCYYCHKSGANIGCCQPACRRTFHTKCGIDNMAQNQFRGTYKSYCHSHVRNYRYRPAPDEDCVICQDRLMGTEERFNVCTMLHSPCCRNGWYHRLCLQAYANSAGYFFKCPLCNNSSTFHDVALRGISVPNSDASWEAEPDAYVEQTQREQFCTASRCLSDTRFLYVAALIYCTLCGSNPVHQFCTKQNEATYSCMICSNVAEASQIYGPATPNRDDAIDEDDYDDPLDRDFVINESSQDPQPEAEKEKQESNKQAEEEDSDTDDDKLMTMAFDSIIVRRCLVHGVLSPTSQARAYNLRSLSNQENDAPTPTVAADVRGRRSQTALSARSLDAAVSASTSAATGAATTDEENKDEKPSGSPGSVQAPSRRRRFLRSLSPEATASRSSARIQNRLQQQQQQQQEPAAPTDPNDAATPTASTSNVARRRRFTTTGASSSLNDLASPNMDISCVANRTRRRLPFYKTGRK